MRSLAAAVGLLAVASPAVATDLGLVILDEVCRYNKNFVLSAAQLTDLMDGIQTVQYVTTGRSVYYSRSATAAATDGGRCSEQRVMGGGIMRCHDTGVTLNGNTLIRGVAGPQAPC
ncbi:hypothetical protein EDC65_0279 [Stella humosa]|uniref:Secreted protein n=1 Tax=Stella humosa TaxID=94 RepID=A0A3N1M0S6_9PROT|nr:hypothetical protein [Stella humosa]ROQ01104.1 hypothetical protein EDC65_0279 [Stella humosa]BBK31476.1 hypothetical protein STHU_21100 [Stella humosa]